MEIVKKVSIIVPVYNTSLFLDKCLESITRQTIKELEIILINDGSTDNSLEICKAYEAMDKRIILIDQKNRGLSAARNTGVQAATGEYIGFVDSDDWIEPDMFEKMYLQAAQSESEVCICDYKVNNVEEEISVSLDIEKDIIEKDDLFNLLVLNIIAPKDFNSNSKNIAACVWRMLIKKEFLEKNNILFVEGITFMEDIIYSLEVYSKCNKVAICREYLYHYMYNSNSITIGYKNNCMELNVKVFERMKEILKEEYDYSLIEKRMDIRYINMSISSIVNEVGKNNPKTLSEQVKSIYKICNDDMLKKILSDLEMKGNRLRKRATLFAMKYRMGISLYLYYKLGIVFSRTERR